MQGNEMKDIRERLGMTELQLARAIGYTGTDRNDDTRIREYERGKKQIPLYIARLVWLMARVIEGEWIDLWQPADKSVEGFPDFPGYDFEHIPDSEVAK